MTWGESHKTSKVSRVESNVVVEEPNCSESLQITPVGVVLPKLMVPLAV